MIRKKAKLMNYGGYFDIDKSLSKIKELENKMNEPNFWDDKKSSEKVINELNNLKNKIEKAETIKEKITTNLEMLEIIKIEYDEEIKLIAENDIDLINKDIENLETEMLLNKEYDSCDAILEIHPGAGGTESCDWASMLKRMYLRWADKHNLKYEIIDELPGEEAGIKSFTVIIKGQNVYGNLKNEKGVHRLIRISPFDSGGRRHTSFAAILVTPLFDKNIDIEIKETDIRIDVYRSSGCGGQGVNTTDSAVRITHLPTKIVVTCQNERSQIQNKEKALEVLKNKLYQKELEEQKNKMDAINGSQMEINFGSQIRTYTMCPYSLVKDHRTNTEDANVGKVLDGDIDKFIYDNLKVGNI